MKRLRILSLLAVVIMIVSCSASAMPIFDRHGHVIVLTYHKISEKPSEWSDYCIPPKMFEDDIKYLAAQGYSFVTASELATVDKDKKTAVITFDDGYESDLKYAAPVLQKYGAKASFFIIGSAVGTDEYMTAEQIAALAKMPCAEIGNHSYKTHFKNYGTLTVMYKNAMYEKELLADFAENDAFIKKIIGKAPVALTYPNGIFSENIDKKLHDGGKLVTFSTLEKTFCGIKSGVPVGRRNRSYYRNIADIVKRR